MGNNHIVSLLPERTPLLGTAFPTNRLHIRRTCMDIDTACMVTILFDDVLSAKLTFKLNFRVGLY